MSFTSEVTFERAKLFEHCRRAVSRGLTTGPHGLPLMGTGDWNDGLNLVGADGKGDGVIPLERSLIKHQVLVRMGDPEETM